jgi:sugar (pentulose or hexulose) kinase
VDALRAIGAEPVEIVLVGGAARRAETLQLRADACNLPVIALADPEATTAGAAMLAGVAAGVFADVRAAARTLVRRVGRCEPRPEQAEALWRARARWRERGTELFGP